MYVCVQVCVKFAQNKNRISEPQRAIDQQRRDVVGIREQQRDRARSIQGVLRAHHPRK